MNKTCTSVNNQTCTRNHYISTPIFQQALPDINIHRDHPQPFTPRQRQFRREMPNIAGTPSDIPDMQLMAA